MMTLDECIAAARLPISVRYMVDKTDFGWWEIDTPSTVHLKGDWAVRPKYLQQRSLYAPKAAEALR